MFFNTHNITQCSNQHNKPLIHFKPYNDNWNVKCLNGSAHVNRTVDKTKVTCKKCLDDSLNLNFWFDHEQKHGNENKNF